MPDFFHTYFLDPILRNGWFNPVNTLVYSIILIIAVFLVFKLITRLRVGIDRYFFLGILPFIFWASSTRVLHDSAVAGVLGPGLQEIYISPIFPTPGSYIITFSLALFVFLLSLTIQRFTKIHYWKPMFTIGLALCILNVYLLPIVDFVPFLIIIPITLTLTLLVYLPNLLWRTKLFKKISPGDNIRRLFSLENTGIVSGHLLDASATVTALTLYGYVEQHVVPRFLFPILGTPSFFALKILVVLPVLWIIDRYSEEGNFRNFLKIVVLILGLAPGLRDLLRLMTGV